MDEYVNCILRRYLPDILTGDGVAVPDDAEEMSWRLFFAHSQDMQGFRADIFTGGPNEEAHPSAPAFQGLRCRWADSRTMIDGLASLWQDAVVQGRLKRITGRSLTDEEKGRGVELGMEVLRTSRVEAVRVFAETLADLKGDRVARKTNKMIRAYIQNAYLLQQHGCSFRNYLASNSPDGVLPPADVVGAEKRWIEAIERDFYNVGPALASYLICDWLLWLWREGRVDWFESHKEDSVHLTAVQQGWLPAAAAEDFVAYCRTIRISDGHGRLSGKPCPPRILNECLWLDRNQSTPSALAREACFCGRHDGRIGPLVRVGVRLPNPTSPGGAAVISQAA